jgi:hypothetical protein
MEVRFFSKRRNQGREANTTRGETGKNLYTRSSGSASGELFFSSQRLIMEVGLPEVMTRPALSCEWRVIQEFLRFDSQKSIRQMASERAGAARPLLLVSLLFYLMLFRDSGADRGQG